MKKIFVLGMTLFFSVFAGFSVNAQEGIVQTNVAEIAAFATAVIRGKDPTVIPGNTPINQYVGRLIRTNRIDYDKSTGTFRIKQPGVYSIFYGAAIDVIENDFISLQLYKNGTKVISQVAPGVPVLGSVQYINEFDADDVVHLQFLNKKPGDITLFSHGNARDITLFINIQEVSPLLD